MTPDEGYEIARKVTDQVLGAGTYAFLNWDHPDPSIRAKAREGYQKRPFPPPAIP